MNSDSSTKAGEVWVSQAKEMQNWQLMLYVLLAVHLVLSLWLSPIRISNGDNRGWLVSLIATIAVAISTATLGKSVIVERDLIGSPTRYVHLSIVLIAVTAISATGYLPTFLWLFSYIQVWMLIWGPRVWPIIGSLAFVLIPFLAYWVGFAKDQLSFADLLPSIMWNFAICVGFGWFITRQFEQTEKYAALYDQLTATQAQLAQSLHDAGVAAERERVGAEIHDTLAQGFTSIVIQAQVAKAAIGRNDAAAKERLDLIEQVARDNLIEARGLVTAMAPAPLHTGGLSQAIQDTAARFATESGIPVTVTVPDDSASELSCASEVVLVRATQEALANIRRHSGATNAQITLTDAGSENLTLEISDNGSGIPDGAKIGYGLSGMRNRVEAAGGNMEILTNQNGTTIRIDLPKES